VTSYPRAFSEGRRAAPMGPETPLTRILEIMLTCLPLYQSSASSTKPATDSKKLKLPKPELGAFNGPVRETKTEVSPLCKV
jgi:hypothetical protein